MRHSRVPVTVVLTSYDHVYPVSSGEVGIAGTDPAFGEPPAPPGLRELAGAPGWDIADVPLAPYLVRRLAGDEEITALPVVTARMFPHGSLYVRRDRIAGPEDLRGAALGTTAAAATAALYARGMLADMHGISAAQTHLTQVPAAGGQELAELLREGTISAMVAPGYRGAAGQDQLIGCLFARPGQAEREYAEKLRIFPVMRVLAVRRELLDRHRWLATNIYRAFEIARRRYFARLEDIRASRVPVPSAAAHLHALRELFGGEFWPYGVEPNRAALETLIRYAREQGVIPDADVDVAGLFAPVEPFVDGT